MRQKQIDTPVLILNILGSSLLCYYGLSYVSHNPYISNPDAMIVMKDWEAAGILLTVGIVPLFIANLGAYHYLWKEAITGRKRLLFFLPTVICVLLSCHFWLSGNAGSVPAADSTPVVKVKAEKEGAEEAQYLVLYNDGGMSETDPFMNGNAVIHTFDGTCFTAEVSGNKIRNTVNPEELPDDISDAEKKILNAIAEESDHAIYQVRIFSLNGAWFAEVLLNVNWQDPMLFYRYDMEHDSLILLYSGEGVRITGISNVE